MGSHDVFIADILSVSCREEIIDKDGKIHFERADLLAYAHGEYYSLGERVGRFGFSTDKTDREAHPTENTPAKEKREEKRPFYLDAPRGKTKKRKTADPNKGKPKMNKRKKK